MTEVNMKIKTPRVPSFLTVMVPENGLLKDGPTIAVSELSDEQIEALVKDWRLKLIENAKRQRELR